jgi:hypothetical protein
MGALYVMRGSRPDIAFACAKLAQFCANPGRMHWNALKRLIGYLHHTRHYRLVLGGKSPISLGAMTDSDFAACPDSRRSVSGYVHTLGSGAVSWSSRKQELVTTSTTEAEYVAMCNATKETMWLRQLLSEIGFAQTGPTLTLADNQGAIILSEDQANHERTKAIDVKFHYTREHVLLGDTRFRYVRSCDNVADIFTKPLHYPAFKTLRARLGLALPRA